mmetsp:Transcript_24841/g.49648  ORF Transcript_24841/g.49648 Transcript_24841/m.49648 type:complete len:524 (-) Transcript_24841:84-1655(-)
MTEPQQLCSFGDLESLGFSSNLTPSSAAVILACFPTPVDWAFEAEWRQVTQYVEQAVAAQGSRLPMPPLPDVTTRQDPRSFNQKQNAAAALSPTNDSAGAVYAKTSVVRIFTDMDTVRKAVNLSGLEWASGQSEAECDVLLVTKPVKDFLALPPRLRICQFPYEGALVRKDLLPLTVRRFCFKAASVAGDHPSLLEGAAAVAAVVDGAGGDSACAPPWWLPCFDLSTEFHLFAQEHNRRCRALNSFGTEDAAAATLSPCEHRKVAWILKPAIGTHGIGHVLVDSLWEAAQVVREETSRQQASGGGGNRPCDRVAQLLVMSPLLALSREEEEEEKRKRAVLVDSTLGRDGARAAQQPQPSQEEGEEEKAGIEGVGQEEGKLPPPPRGPTMARGGAKKTGSSHGRKFDLRVFVLVRSFSPTPEIYRHAHVYARLAYEPYDDTNLNYEVQITTGGAHDAYDYLAGEKPTEEQLEVDDGQERLVWSELVHQLRRERGPLFDADKLLGNIDKMLGHLFCEGGKGAIGG